jgi:thiamine-phosphate pyrophosphorylase
MQDRHSVLRILDANANRAAEGLRVVEEYVRMVLGDRYLTGLHKQLRHDLSAALGGIPASELLVARDTLGDVGTQVAASDEYQRSTPREVWQANQKRVEQSLRCLEEFAKPLFPAFAVAIESLRYRSYTLAKAVAATERARQRLAESRLYVLIDGGSSSGGFAALVTDLIGAGVHLLQLRDKRLADRELLERARTLRALTRNTATLFVMNDRADLAELSDADGVHVGQEELRVADVRALIAPQRLIGVSTHSLDQARQAVLEGADYLGCGPVFPSGTKSFPAFPGTELLRQVAAEITLPAFAIGGIAAENVPSILQSGISRIAVCGAVTQSEHPGREAQRLLRLLENAG